MRHLRGRFSRASRLRRWVFGLLLLVTIWVVAVLVYAANPARVGQLSAALLADMSGADVAINSVSFAVDGSIRLHDVQLRVPEMQGPGAQLFSAEQVLVRHDLFSLLRGRFRPKSLTFLQPTLWITEDVAAEKYNHQFLRERRRRDLDRPERLPKRLPELFIRNGSARFGQIEEGQYELLGTVALQGNLTQMLDRPAAYFFRLRQEQGQSGELTLTGQFDLKDQSIAAKLEHFTLDAPQRVVLPSRLRKWWDRLEPEGSLPTVRLEYDQQRGGLHALLEVRDIALTVPYNDVAFRMTEGSGRFTLTRQTVTITDLRGKVEGFPYAINGQIDGLNEDSPFRMTVRIGDSTIPEDPDELPVLPAKLVKQVQRFAPSGTFNGYVQIRRDQAGAAPSVEGKVSVLDAKLRYAKFPYPLHNLKGELTFDDASVEIVSLRGQGPTGATIAIQGTIAPPGDGAAVHLEIQALDLPIDEHVDAALKPKQKQVIDLFRDTLSLARLTEHGLMQAPARFEARALELRKLKLRRIDLAGDPDAGDELTQLDRQIAVLEKLQEVPRFELGGKTTISIVVDRAFGPDAEYESTVKVNLAGMGVLFEHWPYPLKLTQGVATVGTRRVVIEGVQARGLSGAVGKLEGVIEMPEGRGGPLEPDITLRADDLPLDRLLLASLPPPQAEIVAQLHPTGVLDAQGRIFRSEEEEFDFEIDADLRDGVVRPFDGEYELEKVTGRIGIRRGGVTIEEVTGSHAESVLTVAGQTLWQEGEPAFDLTVRGADMQFEDAVTDLLPPQLEAGPAVRELFETHKPSGAFNFDLKLTTGKQKGVQFALGLDIADLAFDLRGTRIALAEIGGELAVTPGQVRFDDWGASFASGSFALTGSVGLEGGRAIDLTVSAKAEKIDDDARAVLPEGVVSVIDGLELQGGYKIEAAQLTRTRNRSSEPVLAFAGKVQLDEAQAVIGVPITAIDAELAVASERVKGAHWPQIALRLDAERLRVADRLVSPLTLAMSNRETPSHLAIEQLIGECYGGVLMAEGDVDMARAGAYRMHLTLQDAQLTPFIEPLEEHAEQAIEEGGVVSANLSIRGVPGEVESRQGRGALEVRDANMVRLPLAMALLQMVNLTLPRAGSFDQASAHYLIDGDTIHFDSVRFDAPTVEIAGSGTMAFESQKLDLSLFTRNPAGPNLGPVTDMFKVFKDELLTIHVTGTLQKPEANVKTLSGVKKSWQQIFGGDQPQKPPAAPSSTPASSSGAASTSGQ